MTTKATLCGAFSSLVVTQGYGSPLQILGCVHAEDVAVNEVVASDEPVFEVEASDEGCC